MHNEKSAKLTAQWYSKLPELLAKHGIKMVGGWTVNPEHLVVQAYEAPNAEAMQAYMMDPAVEAMSYWQKLEVKPALTMEEFGQMLQQKMQQKQA